MIFHSDAIIRKNHMIMDSFVLVTHDFLSPPVATIDQILLKSLSSCLVYFWFCEGIWTRCETLPEAEPGRSFGNL